MTNIKVVVLEIDFDLKLGQICYIIGRDYFNIAPKEKPSRNS